MGVGAPRLFRSACVLDPHPIFLINSPAVRPLAFLRKLKPPTTDQKPGHRPLSFSSGGDLGGPRAVVSALVFWSKNHLHFDCQNLEKTKVLGGQNGFKN